MARHVVALLGGSHGLAKAGAADLAGNTRSVSSADIGAQA